MATAWPLKVLLDVPESRVDLGRIALFADGISWDMAFSDANIYMDAVTNTAMLRPLPTTPEYETTFTGDYARYAFSDLSFPTPSKWVVNQVRGVGDYFFESQGVNEVVQTKFAVPINQPLYFGVYIDGVKNDSERVVFVCGWSYGTPSEIKIELMSSGQYRIYKGGSIVGQYSAEASVRETVRIVYKTNSSRGKFLSLTLLPCRYRDLLIIDANGSALCHSFVDLESIEPDGIWNNQQITPPGPVFFYVPNGKASVQAGPVKFRTSGNLYGPIMRTRYPMPPSFGGFTTSSGYYYMGNAGGTLPTVTTTVVKTDGSAFAFYDGTVDLVRIKVELASPSSDVGVGMNFASAYSDVTRTTTSNTNTNITTKIESLNFSVNEDGRVSVSMTARKKMLEDAGVNRPEIIGNRTFAIQINNGVSDIDVVRGQFDPPEIEYFDRDDSANHDWALLTFKGADRQGLIDRLWFQDVLSYDHTAIDVIIQDLIVLSGFPTTDAIITANYTLSATSLDHSLGKYALMPERGDTIGKWIDKIHQEYCSTWVRGWMPTSSGYKYRFIDPNELNPTPVVTLYQSISTATTAGVAEALRPQRVIRRLTEVYERPECNQLQIVGQDPHTKLLLWATYNDFASQSPGTTPASRPENWLGSIEPVLYEDPAMHTLDSVSNVGLILAQRLMPGRHIIEWESDFLVSNTTDIPLWIGDCVRVMEPDGTTQKGDYQIIAITNVNFNFEGNGNTSVVRSAKYKAVKMRVQSLQATNADNSGMFAFPR